MSEKCLLFFVFYRAAEYLVRTGPIVTLEVAKQGAIYHGLATLLSQPSPIMTRGN
jgi:afadin